MAGNVEHLSTTAPNLRELEIKAGSFELGALELPLLESLIIETTGMRAREVAAIRAARWPSLRKLVLWFGSLDRGVAGLDDVVPLLGDASRFPVLDHLGLCNNEFTDALIAPLAASPLLRQLEYLDLSKGTLSDVGAAAIVAERDRFAHVEEIAVGENFIDTPAIFDGYPSDVVGLDDQRVFEPEYYRERYCDTAE
jgi:hypothetical protein